LTVGLAAVAISWAVADAILLRPPPFEGSERLIGVVRSVRTGGGYRMDRFEYENLRKAQTTMEDVVVYTYSPMIWTGREQARSLFGIYISTGLFEMLKQKPARGRFFLPGEDAAGAPPVAVISHEVWEREFEGADDAVGASIVLDGVPRTIVGVAPEGFSYPGTFDVWVPMEFDLMTRLISWSRGGTGIGLLKPGVSIEQAEAELALLAEGIRDSRPGAYSEEWTFNVYPRDFSWRTESEMLLRYGTMLGLSLLVLAMATVNVGNLLFMDAVRRGPEFAIRSALGASRRQLFMDVGLQAVLVSATAAVLAALLAWWAMDPLWHSFRHFRFPEWMRFELNLRVIGFVSLFAILAATGASLLPAWRATGRVIEDQLRESQRANTSLRAGMLSRFVVAGQVALACAVFVAVLVTYGSLAQTRAAQLPFDPDPLMSARVLSNRLTHPEQADRARFFMRLEQELRAEPMIAAAAATSHNLYSAPNATRFRLPGQTYADESEEPRAYPVVVTPGYFETLGVNLERGRNFDARDDASSLPVCIVNVPFVEQHFPGGNAMGQSVTFPDGEARTIVGIAPDLRHKGFGDHPDAPRGAAIYTPQAQAGHDEMTILTRPVAGRPAAAVGAMRAAVGRLDPNVPLIQVMPWRQQIDEGLRLDVFYFRVCLISGLAAALLAAIGVYSIIAFTAQQRTREFGIRVALGATPAQIRSEVLRAGLTQLAVGLVVGVGLAVVVARLLNTVIFPYPEGVSKFVLAAALVGVTAIVAISVPALAAGRVAPQAARRLSA